VGVDDNAALGGLAEHFGQARADEPIIARLKRSGFESGNSFDIDKLDPSVREALANVPKDAQKLMAGLGRGAIGAIGMVLTISDHIARSERKLVITITSGMGSLADNTSGGSIAYRSSKAAVNMAMRSAAIDLAPRGITRVLVNPGWVRTDMGRPKAPLSPQESVTSMRRLIATFGPNQSGKFYNYDGREYP
jgi:NAD(P)-dependent dehydrogenase (short-subunit alcohol dehydrogenase family)